MFKEECKIYRCSSRNIKKITGISIPLQIDANVDRDRSTGTVKISWKFLEFSFKKEGLEPSYLYEQTVKDMGKGGASLSERRRIDRQFEERNKKKLVEDQKPMVQPSTNVNEAEFLISCKAAADGVRQDFINSHRDFGEACSTFPVKISNPERLSSILFPFRR